MWTKLNFLRSKGLKLIFLSFNNDFYKLRDILLFIADLIPREEFKLKTQFPCFLFIRLLGRFAPIFYLTCEHILFVYILKQRRKKCCGFKKKIADFQELIFF